MRTILCAAAIGAAMLLASCSTSRTSPPELEQNVTYDGLAKVKNTTVSGAWMRPDFTLAGYTKIMLQGAGIEYRPVKPVNRMAGSSASQFPVTPEQQARLRTIVQQHGWPGRSLGSRSHDQASCPRAANASRTMPLNS